MKPLSVSERQLLKARAHALKPVVAVGNEGLTPGVLREIDTSLKAHELIKIRAAGGDRSEREELLSEICAQCGAQAVQVIGKILVVYRERPETPPAPSPPKPRRKPARRTKQSYQNE